MREIYRNGMTQEVFGWIAASNNQAYVAGRLSLALNAVSIARTLEGPPWVTTTAAVTVGPASGGSFNPM